MRSESDAILTTPNSKGTGEWRVDGYVTNAVVTPATAEEAAEVLADAAERALAVTPIGGGTKLALGNPPERLDLVLSTTRLNDVIDYAPTDLTLSVGAGARFGDVQATLAEHGQGLPLDIALPSNATIGGLIATAIAGPRRLGSGNLRDLLIGIAVAHPSGAVTKSGGMVVKNVSGFDLPRLYHGSLGTLGVIVSANFKVLPLARAEATILATFDDLGSALDAAGRVRASRLNPAALEVFKEDNIWRVAVRQEGREGTIGSLANEARSLVGADEQPVYGAVSASWWQRYADSQSIASAGQDVLIRCTTRPRQTGELTRHVLTVSADSGMVIEHCWISIGLGSVMARLAIGATGDLAQMQELLLTYADHATILAAPPDWKSDIDVWGRPPETLDVMRSLKEHFDPTRILNPGRFAGRI